jgi:hypothetical protein
MKTFELSSRKSKNGRRKFKAILYEIFPDSCIDEVGQVGTQFNENGITWIKEYCQAALPSIQGMSLKCEFLDDERTELCGHGETEICSEDGLPVFENAVVVGTFDKGYIEEIEMPNGEIKTVCVGEGTIDGLCYNNFCKKLDEDIKNGNAPSGSVEILKTGDNDGIVYKYGYKEFGRIPTVFEHSGYALLGVRPADQTAKILELNSKEDKKNMDEMQVKALVGEVVNTTMNVTAEMNKCKDECAAQVAAATETITDKDNQISELNSQIETIKAELETCKNENAELNAAKETMQSEINELKATIAESEKKEKIGELNSAIASFTDEEKAYAQAEIDAFNADPIASEVNSVVSKIWEGVGKKAKTDAAQVAAEQNAVNTNYEDIFSEVGGKTAAAEDTNIF